MSVFKRISQSVAAATVGLLVLTSVLTVAAAPASAQSFFQNLFGFLAPKKPAATKPANRPPAASRKSIPWVGSKEDRDEIRRSRNHNRANAGYGHGGTGGYRTVCVRTCDGYYFPISSGVSSSKFNEDAKTCESRCGMTAKLYYLGKSSDDIAGMRDLDGNTYNSLKTAFAYRKKLKDGCTCRPMPWSAAERARHKRYEVYADYMKLQKKRDAKEQAAREARILELARQRQEREKQKAMANAEAAVRDAARDDEKTGVGVLADEIAAADIMGPHPDRTVSNTDQTIQPVALPVKPQARRNKLRTRRISGARSYNAQRPQKRKSKPKPAMGLGGLFGGGGGSQKYSWPGDR